VYACAGVSGAHINPAVTLALAVRRGFPWRSVLPYVAAQMAGAFVGAFVVYVTYVEALTAFDQGVRQVLGPQGTAGIFATYPAPYLSTLGGFIDQVVGTALLVAGVFFLTDERNAPPTPGMTPLFVGLIVVAIGMAFGVNAGYAINPARDPGPRRLTAVAGRRAAAVLSLTDERNAPPTPGMTPLFVGLIVVAIGMAFGVNAGYAINPARDLGPRLFTAVAGWGTEVFTAANGWWWVPVVAP